MNADSRKTSRQPSRRDTRRSGEPRGRRLVRDTGGNIQVIEAILVASLVAGAIFTVSTFDVPVTESEGFKANNERLVEDSLKALYHRESTYNSGQTFGSMLEQYVMEALAGDSRRLEAYLNKSLPPGADYNVFLDTGHGEPHRLVYNGEPAKEAVASTYPMVPRLAYTFLKPGFSHYHGDFSMGLSAIPVYHGLLARDEGESVELTVKYNEADGSGPYTLKVYGQTALRHNIATERKWPSASLYGEAGGAVEDGGTATYFIDARNTLLNPLFASPGEDAYSIDFSIRVQETAGVELPRGTKIQLEFPRLWDWNAEKQEELETDETADNAKYWEEFTYAGTKFEGWTLTATLKDPVKDGSAWFNVTGDYRGLIDTAYPYFSPIHVTLGSGVQGSMDLIVKNPIALNVTSVMSRHAWLSMPKPMIGDDTSRWGAAFTNTGAAVDVFEVSMREADGADLFASAAHVSGTAAGSWDEPTDGRVVWTPSGSVVRVDTGEALWLAVDITAPSSTDNSYRNKDYMTVEYHFSSDNTTGTNNLDSFDYTKRAWRQSPEWTYNDMVQPYDDDGAYGWPDQNDASYWATASSYYDNHELIGNTTYHVFPTAVSSNTFGEYRGAASRATLSLMDDTAESRQYTLAEDVYIKNDFTAIFDSLTTVNAMVDVSVGNDITVRSELYTPDKAWKGVPSKTFTETISGFTPSMDDVVDLVSDDISGDGVVDLIMLDQSQVVSALDGRDGSRFWEYDPGSTVKAMRLGDIDDDNEPELVLGLADGEIIALDTAASGITKAARLQWTHTWEKTNVAATIKDIALVGNGATSRADILVSGTWSAQNAEMLGLDVTSETTVESVGSFVSSDLTSHSETGMPDIHPVRWNDAIHPSHVALSAANGTTMLFDVDGLRPVWFAALPDTPNGQSAADLDGDGRAEVLVNTAGREIYVLNGTNGRYGPQMRAGADYLAGTPTLAYYPVDSVTLPDGGVIVVDLSAFILQDRTGLFNPQASIPSTDPTNPSYDDYDDILASAPTELDKEWAVAQRIGDTAYIVGRDGEVRRNTTSVGKAYYWETVKPAVVGYASALLYDAHLEPDFADGGAGYAIDDHGVINKTGDGLTEWTTIGALCGTGPANLRDCTNATTYVYKWHVETHADGTVDKVYVVDDDANQLTSFDVDTRTWTVHQTFPGPVTVIDRDDEGTWYVAGDNMYIAEASDPSGPWTRHEVHGTTPDENGYVADFDMIDATTGYALGTKKVFRYVGNDEWQPLLIDEGDAPRITHFMNDDDGETWMWGESYDHAPLSTYKQTAEAVYALDLGSLGGIPDTIVLDSDEHDRADQGHVEWAWREQNATAWLPLRLESAPSPSGKSELTRKDTSIACVMDAECSKIELRATLKTRTYTPELSPLRHDPSFSPLVSYANVTLRSGVDTLAAATLDLADMASGDAAWTDLQDGIRLPTVPMLWGIRDEASGADRTIHGLDHDISGGTGSEVMVTNATGTWVWDGASGRFAARSPWTSLPEAVLVEDMTGDEKDDVTAVFKGEKARTWNILTDTETTIDNDAAEGAATTAAIVDKSADKTNRSFAFGGSEATIYVVEDDTTDGDAPAIAWSTAPNTALGKITFKYDIPENALFGVYFVVSEMSWEFEESTSGTVSQTARLVQWFDVTPKNGKMPDPPIYEVEIVSWYNEF